LPGQDFNYLPTKAERIEQVIADDAAFLDAHPWGNQSGGRHHEGPSARGQKAQPAADGRACEAAEALTGS
jgi:hypothetical protein